MIKKVVIVVLNYMNYRETFQCVDSVLSQKGINFEIVIVDNGSPNESYKKLRERYGKNKLIHLLRSNKNYGFAKGNNIGIHYAKQKLSADFLLLLNSDTELIQDDYISILLSKYEENVAVISSRIIQKKGGIQDKYDEYVEFPSTLFQYVLLICDYYGFFNISKKVYQLLENKKRTEILHGSSFMLTPSFFEHYKVLYSKTFLYAEEILLYIYCQKAGLIQIQTNEAVILHKGKQSSKYLYENRGSIRKKYQIASYKYVVWESFKVYIKKYLTNIYKWIFKIKNGNMD